MTPRRPPPQVAGTGGSQPGARLDPEALAALEEERQFLLDSLRDLEGEREAGDIGGDDYATLRDDYTARAADVLRRLEEAKAPAGKAPRTKGPRGKGPHAGRRTPPSRTVPQGGSPATTSRNSSPRVAREPGRERGRRRTVLTVAVVLGVALVAGISVAAFSGDRIGGQGATGGGPSTLTARLAQAHLLESEGKAADALKQYDAVLREDPANVEALTYRGWVLARAGLTDPAMTALDRALALDPKYPDAHFFRGMVLYQGRNDPAGAVAEFEAFLANNPPPDSVPAVRDVLERARRDAGLPSSAGPTAPPTTGPPTTAGG